MVCLSKSSYTGATHFSKWFIYGSPCTHATNVLAISRYTWNSILPHQSIVVISLSLGWAHRWAHYKVWTHSQCIVFSLAASELPLRLMKYNRSASMKNENCTQKNKFWLNVIVWNILIHINIIDVNDTLDSWDFWIK